MKKVSLYIYILINLELCCAICHFRNLHSGHKLIEINDEALLKKENFTIESSKTDINEIIKKTVALKESIEKEIKEIDKLYDKVNNELIKSFELKYEKLKKQEKDLKEKLQNEVTKIKEKLENYLSESNRIIKLNEKINKGIHIIEKEEKNILKNLSYVSKINKNKKEMRLLHCELMKNAKISFQEEQTNINFEYYYFNGIQIPKNIEFKNIEKDKLTIFWKIENINIINIDNKKINFRVEIRKDNEKANDNKKEKFIKVYEGNKENCLVENLSSNTFYEIRICCVYDDLIGIWSEVQKVKTLKNDSLFENSNIITEESKKLILSFLPNKPINTRILYDSKINGESAKTFHSQCDGKFPTIYIVESKTGYIFGGYLSIPWKSENNYFKDEEAFFFSVNLKKKYSFTNKNIVMYGNPDYGPVIRGGIRMDICSNFSSSESCFIYLENENQGSKYEISGGKEKLYIQNYEVHQIEY